jgi:hypothetical protein
MRESIEIVTKNLLFNVKNKLKKPNKGKNMNLNGEAPMNQHRRKLSGQVGDMKNRDSKPWLTMRAENSDDSYESDIYLKDKHFSAIEE